MPLDGSSSSSTVGPLGQHARQVDDAAGAGRQLADELVAEGAEGQQLDELVDPGVRPSPRSRCTDGRWSVAAIGSRTSTCCSSATAIGLVHGQRREQAGVLERPAEAPPRAHVGGARRAGRRASPSARRRIEPRVGRREARDDVEQRGLAGAVGPDEAEDLAGPHVERDAVERPDAAEAAGRRRGPRAPARPSRTAERAAASALLGLDLLAAAARRNTERSRSGRSSSSAVGPSKRISPFSMK